ncbi:MAG: antibiotic biosynthesis monooxygenase [Bryobacterales bacterium]|nr:antibiotic biosynthesis monooxygenase [Bryobacterales bacterium]
MLRVVALFRAKPDKIEELREVLTAFVAPTVKEKGCVFYQLHQNLKDPQDFSFLEEWETEEDLDAHGQSAHIQEGRKKIPDLVEVPADVRRYKLLL